jgi:predicted CXXCH cytochrome family protein
MKITKVVVVACVSCLAVGALSAAVIEWHGFRASSSPNAFGTTTVASSVRDAVNPPVEHRHVNTVAAGPIPLPQGHDAFLMHDASGRGVDEAGTTSIGANQDLLVAGLSSDATQEAAVRPQVSSSAHYVGSESCQKCHAAIYERWKKTPMANVVRDPKTHPDAIIPDLNTNDIARFTIDQVAFVYGSKWKQRYFTKIGDDYYPLPAQWDIGNKKWMKYHVPDTGADWWTAFYPSDNMQRPTGPTCDGCHSVNYDIHTKQVTEWNVGCERCHGPGSEHAAHPTRTNILNPSGMDAVASNDTCIQCHSQGQPRNGLIEGKAYDWPVGYRVGLHLADFWKLEDGTLGQTDFLHFADGMAHKNRMQGNDFVQSAMYRHGVTCASCHDVHGTDNDAQLRKPADKLCLDCHGPTSPNGPYTTTLEEHTHHKDGSPGSQCVACHMPRIETQGVPGSFVSAHTFRFITPAMTDKYKMPNPCTSCHTAKSTAWASQELSSWKTTSPWRVAP